MLDIEHLAVSLLVYFVDSLTNSRLRYLRNQLFELLLSDLLENYFVAVSAKFLPEFERVLPSEERHANQFGRGHFAYLL